MEINETTVLDDRGFIEINGEEAKTFLQNIVTNDIEKITTNFTLFSSILTPQGKYLYEFFIIKLEDGYLLECEKKINLELVTLDWAPIKYETNFVKFFPLGLGPRRLGRSPHMLKWLKNRIKQSILRYLKNFRLIK